MTTDGKVPGQTSGNRDFDGTTLNAVPSDTSSDVRREAGLTVLWHPDLSRVGDRTPLVGLDGEPGAPLSRLVPSFSSPFRDELRPLADRALSRQPIWISSANGTLRVEPAAQSLTLAGRPVRGPVEISKARLREGVVLVLGDIVALLLHDMPVPHPEPVAGLDLVGASAPLVELQQDILRIRDLDAPVLLHGETGTGKELVARAIHETGRRSRGPWVAVNTAALPPALAAGELFGAARGAFTGADQARTGCILDAADGTLFLDEIGVMPFDVQVQLLRFLDDRMVRPLGSSRARHVDTRVVAATDSPLDAAVTAGEFSGPLLHRLDVYSITLPPLRRRKSDLGLLLLHFLRAELDEIGHPERLADGPERSTWLPAQLFTHLAGHRWPGNVRELRNLARRLAIRHHHEDRVSLEAAVALIRTPGSEEAPVEELAAGLAEEAGTSVPAAEPSNDGRPGRRRDAAEITESELLVTLRRHRWEVKGAAEELGVSRQALYRRMDGVSSIRKVSDLSRDEIERCFRECEGSLSDAAARLEVSLTALRRQVKKLEIR